MSTALMVVIAIVVAGCVGIVLGMAVWRRMRTQQLRAEFGPEYDLAVERHGNRADAERELLERKRRHRELDIRSLDSGSRERYREQWTQMQEKFVDDPEAVVGQADRLVTTVAAERGYPTGSFDEQITTLSVDHGHTVDHYRRAHEIGDRAGRKEASTEDLRQAMVHYRALFEDLLGTPPGERDRQADDPQAEQKRLEDRPVEDEQIKDRQEDRRAEDGQVKDEQVDDKRAEDRRAQDKSADVEQVDETRVEDRPAESKRTEDKNRKSDSTRTEE